MSMETLRGASQSRGRNHIFFLAKFFERKEYAVDFTSGRLYANKLAFYREFEESSVPPHK